jgi:TM2 domain-containing membrane protein YozV
MNTLNNDHQRTDLVALDKSIGKAHRIVTGCMVAALAIYLSWFWLLQSKALSTQSDAWGQFGDFIGGVLNPLVAYSAFYWLTRSVRLQKEELLETRHALEDSSAAQTKQATYARTSVRLAALTALINSIMVEVQTQRMQLQFIIDQSSSHQSGSGRLLDGTFKNGRELQEHIAELNAQISTRMTERHEYEQEIKALLVAHR